MKSYRVFYWIKKDRREFLDYMFVSANNAREACKICKEKVKKQTGRNAFRPTTNAPSAVYDNLHDDLERTVFEND